MAAPTKKRHRGLKPHCEARFLGVTKDEALARPSQGGPAHYVFGLDEVGRGCLAGPVVAACAVYKLHEPWPKIPAEVVVTDSKKLNYAQRKLAQIYLEACERVQVFVGEATVAEIDELNILHASGRAMHRAFEQAWARVGAECEAGAQYSVWIDGNYVPRDFRGGPHEPAVRTLIKGDSRSFAIATAAIFAKNHRDEFMWELARAHPGYAWESNVGYSSPAHKDGLRAYGFTEWHRRSFQIDLSAPDSESVDESVDELIEELVAMPDDEGALSDELT